MTHPPIAAAVAGISLPFIQPPMWHHITSPDANAPLLHCCLGMCVRLFARLPSVCQVGPRFEVVVFTASLAKYADPLLDLMDKAGLVRWRLFRESCCPYEGNYVKDLNCLGRDLSSTIIVDNSPHSYIFQPANAVPIGTFIDDMEDQELLELLPQLLQVEQVDDVRRYLGPNLIKQQQQQAPQAAVVAAAAQPCLVR